MQDQFVGEANLPHVQQPLDSELCFAALVASVSREDVGLVSQALGGILSDEDGNTAPPFNPRTEVVLGSSGKMLVMDAIQSPLEEARDVETVIENISGELKKHKPVALLYKKDAHTENGMHWVLITGYSYNRDTDTVDGVEIIDPLGDSKYSADPFDVVDMIDRSMKADGVFAYTLEVFPC